MIKELEKLDARTPKWDMNDLKERFCPICGSWGNPKFVRPDKLKVCECPYCRTWYISPAPSERQLAKFYEEYSSKHQRLPNFSDYELAQEISNTKPKANFIMQELVSMDSIKNKKCLDIGFGRGQYLHWFRELGGIPAGIELEAEAVRFVEEYLNIKTVKEGTIFDVDKSEKFDVVLAIDLVEHPLDILPILEKAASILEKSGLLVVMTPNGSSVSYDDSPVIFRMDLEHMQYFTFQTCALVAKHLGFRIVHLESYGFPYLVGINQPLPKRVQHASLMSEVRRRIRSFPGFHIVNAIRRGRQSDFYREQRMGCYNLFCIFQKPAG